MISEICISNFIPGCKIIYTMGRYVIRNKDFIIASYNIIDIVRFSFYAVDRMGLLEMVKNSIYSEKKYNMFFMSTEDDDFVIIDIMK